MLSAGAEFTHLWFTLMRLREWKTTFCVEREKREKGKEEVKKCSCWLLEQLLQLEPGLEASQRAETQTQTQTE